MHSSGLIISHNFSYSQEEEEEMTQEELNLVIKGINEGFSWSRGEIILGDGIAILNVPEGYKYLDPEQSKTVLTEFWGNPPSDTYGMLFHDEDFPLDSNSSFVIDISFEEDGYVEDDDAEDVDYDDLLESMREDISSENELRAEEGYPTMELLGWAEPPFYDSEQKKLHWAKKILFEGESQPTLNYDIRILGRKGYLVLTAIGNMNDLPKFNTDINTILASAEFNEGHRYEDFDSSVDKIAAYGIGGLIAGKVLLKVGLLSKLGLLLAKFWKLILIAFAAVGGVIGKIFKGKNKDGDTVADIN